MIVDGFSLTNTQPYMFWTFFLTQSLNYNNTSPRYFIWEIKRKLREKRLKETFHV